MVEVIASHLRCHSEQAPREASLRSGGYQFQFHSLFLYSADCMFRVVDLKYRLKCE